MHAVAADKIGADLVGHPQPHQRRMHLPDMRGGMDQRHIDRGEKAVAGRIDGVGGDCRVDIDNGLTTDAVVKNNLFDNIKYAVGLRGAAQRSGGKFYTFDTAYRLPDELPPGRQVPIEALEPISIWNSLHVACLFVLLLAAEWILRKRAGMI